MILLEEEYLQNIFSYLNNKDLAACNLVHSKWRKVALKTIKRRVTHAGKLRLYSITSFSAELSHLHMTHQNFIDIFLSNSIIPYTYFYEYPVSNDLWHLFTAIFNLPQRFQIIELHSYPTEIFECLSQTSPLLRKILALNTRGSIMDLVCLTRCKYLEVLHLELNESVDVDHRPEFTGQKLDKLVELTLMSATNLLLPYVLTFINFTNLKCLSLGKCSEFPRDFADSTLSNLRHLQKLRLEGCRESVVVSIFQTVGNMQSMEHLEMVDADIPDGTDKAIASCTNLSKLLIVPAPCSENLEAANNWRVLCGIIQLRNLRSFKWVFSRISSSENYNDIRISYELPFIDTLGNVQIADREEAIEPVVFSDSGLRAFIELFIPDCMITVKRTLHENLFLKRYHLN